MKNNRKNKPLRVTCCAGAVSISAACYAQTMNTLNVEPLKKILPDDFHYASQHVLEEIESKNAFLGYLEPKLQTIARVNANVFAEIGTVSAYGKNQACVILAQNSKDNLVGIILAKVEDGQLKRLDLCIVPAPQTAERSGDHPK
jgi:hypothetical protein